MFSLCFSLISFSEEKKTAFLSCGFGAEHLRQTPPTTLWDATPVPNSGTLEGVAYTVQPITDNHTRRPDEDRSSTRKLPGIEKQTTLFRCRLFRIFCLLRLFQLCNVM